MLLSPPHGTKQVANLRRAEYDGFNEFRKEIQPVWYIVLSRSLPEKEEDKQRNYEEHRRWLDDQHRAGRLLFSGPTTDGSYGVYIMLAATLDEAKSVAAQDPHHARGIRAMEVLEWRAHRAFRLNGPSITDVEEMAKTE